MQCPDGLRYSKEHEWARAENASTTIGITDFAQQELGDVVFVELPAVGALLSKGQTLGVVESVKAVSDIYAPVSGTVSEINEKLQTEPELVNQDPYGAGWLIKIGVANPAELNALMEADEYRRYIQEERDG